MAHPITQPVPAPDQPTALKSAWAAGIASGNFAIIDLEAVKAEGRKRLSKAVYGKPLAVHGKQ